MLLPFIAKLNFYTSNIKGGVIAWWIVHMLGLYVEVR